MTASAPTAADLPLPDVSAAAGVLAGWAADNAAAGARAGGAWRRQVPAADAASLRARAGALKADIHNTELRGEVQKAAAALVRRGYTRTAIAQAAGVTGPTAARWISLVDPADVADIPVDPPHAEPLQPTTASERFPVPDTDAEELIDLQLRVIADPRDSDAGRKLDTRCGQLRARGYTLQAIANVIDVTREMVRQRAARAPQEALVGLVNEVKAAKEAQKAAEEAAKVKPTLTGEEVNRIQQLRPLVFKHRAGTPPQSPVGLANAEYMTMLAQARDRGVSEYTMAKQIGVTMAAIKFKLRRLEGTLPPSMQPGGKPGPTATAAEVDALLQRLPDQVAALRTLQDEATIRKGRGHRHPGRLDASRRFDAALAVLVTDHHVPLRVLAAALDRTYAALAARLTAHLGTEAARAALTAADPDSASNPDPDTDDPDTDDPDTDDPDPDEVVGEAGDNELRQGHLSDFTPETTPQPAETAPAPATVDPAAQHASHQAHMALVRDLRAAAQAGGHPTQVWDLGQDVSFRHGHRLVNVEVKSVGGGAEQYRLGVGQLLEQVQHHLDHIAAAHQWYADTGITEVVGVLVVTDEDVPTVWQRVADRAGVSVWAPAQARAVFADPAAAGLPAGIAASGSAAT